MFSSVILSLLLPALASAHGFVQKVVIDGAVYEGNSVGTTATISSAIRQVDTNSPVKGATNPDLGCGQGAQPAAQVANANPGSSVQVFWVGGTTGTSNWPHNVGPIMHYMALCDGLCTTYNTSDAEWFKISELGYEPNSQTWYQAELQSGLPANVTIPSTLAAGNYILRSEIIALQLAMTEGGAEFYPSCIQLSVGGSQTGQPTSSEEVTFPGGYTDTEAGILVNVYNPPYNYTFPGPPVATLVSGGSNSGSSTGSGSPTPTSILPSSATIVPSPPIAPSSTSSSPSATEDPCSLDTSSSASSSPSTTPLVPSTPATPTYAASPSSSIPDDPCDQETSSPALVSLSAVPTAPSALVTPTTVPLSPSGATVPSSAPSPSFSVSGVPCDQETSFPAPTVPSAPIAPTTTPLSPTGPSSAIQPSSISLAPTALTDIASTPSPTSVDSDDCEYAEKRSPEIHVITNKKRMHRRRYRSTH